MKKKITRILSLVLSVMIIASCLSVLSVSVSAADYRNGAQSGPSASYAGSRYYRNFLRVPITGDNRTDLIAVALSQLGYQEGAANGAFSGEVSGGANYVEMSYNMGDLGLGYGGSDYPWCASFVSWCLYQSRCTNHATYSSLCRNHSGDYNYIWKEISCAMWVNQLKGAGYFSYSAGMGGSYVPKYGDLVFFKSSSSPSHIGICLYVKDGVLYTVEGNTSDASGLETNGGGVYFKSYSLSSSYLYGFGRLPYVSNSAVTKIDYSGANPTPGLYVANAAKYIYGSEYSTSAVTTIPRFSMFEITRVGANNRLYGTFTDVNGNTVTGWVENNSSRIIQLSSSGVMSGSWEYDGTGFKYKYSDGSYATQGWLQDPENLAWYYIGANGYAQNGWLYLDTGTFYLDTNSNAMLTGHRFIDGRWYYFNNDGYLCDGTWEYDGTGYRYRYIDGTYGANCWLDDATNNYVRYYLDANGYSVRGWQKIGDAWYYFDTTSAALLSGWLYIGDKWYYTDSTGAMQTGWIEQDGNYFYFDSSGARVENTTVDINGSTCTFDENGVLIDGTIIEDTETPVIGDKYESYTQGMAGNGVGTIYAHGIDISKWNNGDDWTTLKLNLAAVKAAGIDFVIIRCGSTNKGEDPMFDMYYNECKRLGLDVGAYFYSYALDAAGAVSDAQKCLSYIQGKQFEYPIYMDYEDPTQETLSNAKATEICTAFLDTVAAGGYLTGVYTYKSWFERGWVDSSGIRSKYEGWVTYPITSQNHSNYDVEFSKSYGMYQYTFEYVIANAGTFDANVCYKDYPTIVKTYGFNNYAASSTPNLSASWVQDDNGLRYQYSDGTFAPPGWLWDSANSAWYYLDQNGYAVSGWVEDGGKTYYLDPNSNAMLTGHRYIDGNWYYFDSSGAMVTNGMWYQDENGFKYQMGDGTFVYSGWIDEPISGARYYLDANGYAVSGFQTIDGTLYYFFTDSHALLRDSWVTLADGNVYRAAPDGAILKGFQYIDGEYFYFDSNGAMQTGFVSIGGEFYYFDTDGTMVTGWFTSPKTGYIYYFDEEGKMTVGWYEEDGTWYFFEDNMDNHYGQMLTGWITSSSSGYTYYLAEDGKMVTGWQEIDGNTYYFDGNDETYTGRMITGEKEIDGVTYTFDDNGVLIEKYTVEFVDWDGTVLSTQVVDVEASATAPADPTRAGYIFLGWDKDFSSITGNLTVTAQYEEVVVNLLGSFNEWSAEEGKMTATADNIYTKTLELEAGTYIFKILTEDVWYGNNGTIENTTTATSDIGWEMSDGAGDCTLQASGGTYIFNYNPSTKMLEVLYEVPKYEVIFKDYDGTVLKTEFVEAGKSATAPADPTRDGYNFIGWDADFSNITNDIIITAKYGLNSYTVTFLDYDGSVISTQTVIEGESAVAPDAPEREADAQYSYYFAYWDGDFTDVKGDVTVKATYINVLNKYVVTFLDADGKHLATQVVAYGSAATAPEVSDRTDYEFAGWDKEFNNITSDLEVTAVYNKVERIYYLRGDFNSWQTTDAMTKGENGIYTAVFTLDAGTYEYKAANEDYSMEWPLGTNQSITLTEKSVVTFTLDTTNNTLKADVESIEVKYTVTFIDYNGSILSTQYVTAGGTATEPATPQRQGYRFVGWSRNFNNINADRILVAQYELVEVAVNKYSVVFVDADGKLLSSQTVDEGESATAPEAPKKSGYEFAGWDKDYTSVTTNLTVKATYTKIDAPTTPVAPATTGKLSVEVSGGAGFTISVAGGMLRPQGTSYYNTKMPMNTSVKLVANAAEGMEFLGWVNANMVVLSTEETYTFITTGNDFAKAVYRTDLDGASLVIFKNDKAAGGNGAILDLQYYVAGEEIVIPANPAQAGYDFAGWDMTADQIAAKVAAGENVTVLATWTVAEVFVTVKVNGGTFVASKVNADGKIYANYAVTATANAAEAGKKFAYWADAETGEVLSYNAEYKFYPGKDTEITAIYVATDATVDYKVLVGMSADPNAEPTKIRYYVTYYVPEAELGYEFVSAGVIIVDEANYKEDMFYHGSGLSGMTDTAPGSIQVAIGNQPGAAVTKSNCFSGNTYYAKTWVIYRDAQGVEHTEYSDLLVIEKL